MPQIAGSTESTPGWRDPLQNLTKQEQERASLALESALPHRAYTFAAPPLGVVSVAASVFRTTRVVSGSLSEAMERRIRRE